MFFKAIKLNLNPKQVVDKSAWMKACIIVSNQKREVDSECDESFYHLFHKRCPILLTNLNGERGERGIVHFNGVWIKDLAGTMLYTEKLKLDKR